MDFDGIVEVACMAYCINKGVNPDRKCLSNGSRFEKGAEFKAWEWEKEAMTAALRAVQGLQG
jgi:hypothetical protein